MRRRGIRRRSESIAGEEDGNEIIKKNRGQKLLERRQKQKPRRPKFTSSDASSDSDDSDSDSDSDSYSSDYSSSYYSSSEDEEERARLDHLAELRIQRLDRFEAKESWRPQINSDVPLFVSLVTSIQVKQNFLIT